MQRLEVVLLLLVVCTITAKVVAKSWLEEDTIHVKEALQEWPTYSVQDGVNLRYKLLNGSSYATFVAEFEVAAPINMVYETFIQSFVQNTHLWTPGS
jgi:hypothetical protein